MIGSGRLQGAVTVDQSLCPFPEERLDLHHPRGGGPKYLTKPLMDHYRDYLQDYARTVLKDGGQPAMKRSMEHLRRGGDDGPPRMGRLDAKAATRR